MYKAMLVEDEATVREGILERIDWQAHGFVLTGTAENGKQALDMLKEQPVDLLITDINMPVMDGLALARHTHESWPDTIVVLLTGYSDFSYAQTAIRYRVHEYILKPITARQLRALLAKLRDELDARAKAGSEIGDELHRAKQLMREQCLQRLLDGEWDDGLPEEMHRLDIPLEEGPAFAAVAGLRLPAGEAQPAQGALLELLAAQARALCYEVFAPDEERIVLLCSGGRVSVGEAMGLLRLAAGNRSHRLSIAFGDTTQSLAGLRKSYREAGEVWQHLYRMPAGSVASPADIENAAPAGSLRAERQALQKAVRLGDAQQATAGLAHIVQVLAQSRRARPEVLHQLHKLAHALDEAAPDGPLPDRDAQERLLARLDSATSLEEAHDVLQEHLTRLASAAGLRGHSTTRQAAEAVEYIHQHYMDPGLSLQTLTGHLAVSTSYFSSLFKNHTGLTFVEYLTRLRMEKAEQLLRTTDCKNYEIAQRVGYDDPNYFGASFKKHTGSSPSEYRKLFKG